MIDYDVNTKNNYYYYRLKTRINDSTYAYSYPVRLKNVLPTRTAYNNTPAKVPGTVEAEKFDVGMEGIAYHDVDVENTGGAFRLGPGVDIYKAGSIYYVANTHPGEWMEYTLSVQKDGLYKVNCYASSPNADGALKIIFDNTDTLSFTIPATDTITSFTPTTKEIILSAGTHILRVLFTQTSEVGLDRLMFQFMTDVIQTNFSNAFKIYPNPAYHLLSIQIPSSSATLSIYRIDGTIVNTYRINQNNQQINVTGLLPGPYVIKCLSAGKVYTSHIIKK